MIQVTEVYGTENEKVRTLHVNPRFIISVEDVDKAVSSRYSPTYNAFITIPGNTIYVVEVAAEVVRRIEADEKISSSVSVGEHSHIGIGGGVVGTHAKSNPQLAQHSSVPDATGHSTLE